MEIESISEQLKGMLEEKKIFKSGKLFKCILGLNVIESVVFSYLLKHQDVSTMELTEIFKKYRSSIQRALIEVNVIERKSMSLKDFSEKKDREDKTKRGYLYVYGAKDLEMVKAQTRELLDKWYASMLNYIENIDSVFDCYEKQGDLC